MPPMNDVRSISGWAYARFVDSRLVCHCHPPGTEFCRLWFLGSYAQTSDDFGNGCSSTNNNKFEPVYI